MYIFIQYNCVEKQIGPCGFIQQEVAYMERGFPFHKFQF